MRVQGVWTYTHRDGPPDLDPDLTPGDRTCGYTGGIDSTGGQREDPHTGGEVPDSKAHQRTGDTGHVTRTTAGSLVERQLPPLIEQHKGTMFIVDPWRQDVAVNIRKQQMLHLRLYSSGTTLLGPSLIEAGLEHLLELCPDCPHLLQFCVVALSEDEIC
ncbi:hypothetical protein Ddye_004560 [Dipteronia dyeriana]|uniref:Uncharacterized protein n=1 Tax=Dipteronia dyeriana TaxID=168575 RepID=A0AAD9XUF0_9ROSI|nr:hypothetical protein Ddye_004560 [Dipteronia dyeriana]